MKKTLKLLHIFASFGQGGVPLRIVTVANALGDSYSHHFISLDSSIHAAEMLDPTLNATANIWPASKGGLLSRVSNYRTYIKEHPPDILITYNWGAIEWTMAGLSLPRLRQLHFESGFGPEEATNQITRRIWTRRLVLPFCEKVIVPSYVLEGYAFSDWKLSKSKVIRIPNGVDLQRFNGQGDPLLFAKLCIPEGANIVGTIAPLRPEKALDKLIAAANYLPDNSYLVIVGDGSERERLEKFAAVSPVHDRIKFFGHTSEPEKIYPLFDIFAMTSSTEQMPNALLQAMASSLPVVSTNVGDIKPIVAASNRDFIVDWHGPEAFGSSCSLMLKDEKLRQSIAADNLAKVQVEYGVQEMLAKYDRLYQGKEG